MSLKMCDSTDIVNDLVLVILMMDNLTLERYCDLLMRECRCLIRYDFGSRTVRDLQATALSLETHRDLAGAVLATGVPDC